MDKSKHYNKTPWWGFVNSPIIICLVGSVTAGLMPVIYAQVSDNLRIRAEARPIAYGIEVRVAPVIQLLPKVLKSGRMDDDRRYRISNSFTGKMEQSPDEFGEIGVPGLLFKYATVTGDQDAALISKEYLSLMVPLEKQRLYSRGAGQADVDLTKEGRKLLERLNALAKETTRIVARATQ